MTVGESQKKSLNKEVKKARKRQISLICPEAPTGWICTKFGLWGPL